MSVQSVKIVNVLEGLLAGNDQAAARNRERFSDAGVLTVNIMSSPGAGKTSLIIKTLAAMKGQARIGVIEGDIAGSIDTEKVIAAGARDAVQINTGGNCHLEANMVDRALDTLDLDRIRHHDRGECRQSRLPDALGIGRAPASLRPQHRRGARQADQIPADVRDE